MGVAVVEREQRERVAVVWLNRPRRRNALSAELIEALRSELAGCADDPDTGAVVLAGRGTVFCAGGDLKSSMAAEHGFVAAHEGRGSFAALLDEIPKLSVPVIAALSGDAMGGGLGVAAACDIVVASEHARLGTPEIRLGLFPWIILAVLQRDVPRKRLAELAFTGGSWSAAEARELGLVNHVVETGMAIERSVAIATAIANRSPAVLAMGKAAFHRVAELPYEQALAYMHSQLSLNLLTEDATEGIAAFLSKRDPIWKGQ